MNNFILGIALRAAKLWSTDDELSFIRYFDVCKADREWLASADEAAIDVLCDLPTSPLQLNFNTTKLIGIARTQVPSACIGTLTMILSAITDELRADIRIGMISWGISDFSKAEWLAKTTVQDRLSLAMSGDVNFTLRTSLSAMSSGSISSTNQMALLMRIMSGSRR